MLPMRIWKGNADPPYQRDGELWTIEECLLHSELSFDPQLSGPVSARSQINQPTSLELWTHGNMGHGIKGVG